MTFSLKKFSAITGLALALPAVVSAHHPLGGEAPQTLMHGLLSGLAHPILGFDHFAFIIAIGLITAFSAARMLAPLAFLVATAIGTALTLSGLTFAANEYLVMASVVLIGFVAIAGRQINPIALIAALGLAGLFHGYAFGAAVIGSEPTPVVAYLAGLLFVQAFILFATQQLTRWLASQEGVKAPFVRISGGLVAGVGLALSIETLEALIFTAA